MGVCVCLCGCVYQCVCVCLCVCVCMCVLLVYDCEFELNCSCAYIYSCYTAKGLGFIFMSACVSVRMCVSHCNSEVCASVVCVSGCVCVCVHTQTFIWRIYMCGDWLSFREHTCVCGSS